MTRLQTPKIRMTPGRAVILFLCVEWAAILLLQFPYETERESTERSVEKRSEFYEKVYRAKKEEPAEKEQAKQEE